MKLQSVYYSGNSLVLTIPIEAISRLKVRKGMFFKPSITNSGCLKFKPTWIQPPARVKAPRSFKAKRPT